MNGKVVEGDLLTYVNENGYFLREKIYELKPSISLASFNSFSGIPSSIYGDPVGTVTSYTSCGKIAAMCGRDRINVVYLWGYNNQYPIAEIRNATYDEVTSKFLRVLLKQLPPGLNLLLLIGVKLTN